MVVESMILNICKPLNIIILVIINVFRRFYAFAISILAFVVALWFSFRCYDIFCKCHEEYLIATAHGIIASEDDIIGLEEAPVVE
jgi:hypothetical protein